MGLALDRLEGTAHASLDRRVQGGAHGPTSRQVFPARGASRWGRLDLGCRRPRCEDFAALRGGFAVDAADVDTAQPLALLGRWRVGARTRGDVGLVRDREATARWLTSEKRGPFSRPSPSSARPSIGGTWRSRGGRTRHRCGSPPRHWEPAHRVKRWRSWIPSSSTNVYGLGCQDGCHRAWPHRDADLVLPVDSVERAREHLGQPTDLAGASVGSPSRPRSPHRHPRVVPVAILRVRDLIQVAAVNVHRPEVRRVELSLLSKTRHGARLAKTFDRARTPYRRLLESEDVSEGSKRELETKGAEG